MFLVLVLLKNMIWIVIKIQKSIDDSIDRPYSTEHYWVLPAAVKLSAKNH